MTTHSVRTFTAAPALPLQPIKRFVKPEEVGALVRHLCSDEAAAITGACLSIDGGWTAR